MEVEFTDLNYKLDNLETLLKKYENKSFYDGMIDELKKFDLSFKEIQKEYFEYSKHQTRCVDRLDKLKDSLVETGEHMTFPIAEWGISLTPFNNKDYKDCEFYDKAEMLISLNNYLAGLRETYPVLLAKYYPVTMYIKNEIDSIRHVYEWTFKCVEVWKMCNVLRMRVYNFEQSLENVASKEMCATV